LFSTDALNVLSSSGFIKILLPVNTQKVVILFLLLQVQVRVD
jgi:hypothetical protein